MSTDYFNKILVAFDGSSDSVQALTLAESIAKDKNASLTVAYVYDQSRDKDEESYSTKNALSHTYVGPGPVPTRPVPATKNSNHKRPGKEKAERVLSSARSAITSNIDVTYETLLGKPAHELKVYARDNKIDLIVIGSRGLSGIKKLVMGSVSKKVTEQAECRVLVAK